MKSSGLYTIAVLAIGSALGWVAASGKLADALAQDAKPNPVENSSTLAQQPVTSQNGKKKPNILVIMGDDIGDFNLSAYNMGRMGYKTPNIDRIAQQGALFTDFYAQPSCTAGRAAFITGQMPIRTGLLKVGLPGMPVGISVKDPTIAELLKPLGYATAQFGKNHLGDRDEMLPTNHGFDEFFGILYHLDAMEEPENPDYPKDPAFKKAFGPRGVIHSFADGRIKDTGPLTRKRMATIDEEILNRGLDFLDSQAQAPTPFFLWWNSTRMHLHTYLKPESVGKTSLGVFADGMVEHDGMVGTLLERLESLGLADNTIVVYVSDNGAEVYTWPDGSTTMFRGEKATQWEGGFRSPCLIRWPGVVKPGTVINEIASLEDMMPTILAAAGAGDVKEKLMQGTTVGNRDFKVHLDGFDLGPALRGEAAWPRNEFFYWTDDGGLAAVRQGNWKVTYLRQNAEGREVWQRPYEALRAPMLTNLRTDPFEKMHEIGIGYPEWYKRHTFVMVGISGYATMSLQSLREFPPRSKPDSWTIQGVVDQLVAPPAK